jgi:hypothetical protein
MTFSMSLKDTRGRVVAQGGELRLEPLAVLGLEVREVDRREHLAELHGGALHAAELLDDLLGDPRVALALRVEAGVVVAPAVGEAAAGGARRLTGDEAPIRAERPRREVGGRRSGI